MQLLGTPNTRQVPAVGARSPRMIFRSVVFPEPFEPSSPTVSPSGIRRVTLFRAQTVTPDRPDAKLLVIPSSSIAFTGILNGP